MRTRKQFDKMLSLPRSKKTMIAEKLHHLQKQKSKMLSLQMHRFMIWCVLMEKKIQLDSFYFSTEVKTLGIIAVYTYQLIQNIILKHETLYIVHSFYTWPEL